MNNKKILLILILSLAAAGCGHSSVQPATQSSNAQSSDSTPTSSPQSVLSLVPPPPTLTRLHEPITNALTRVTKKPFGIYISPKTSPVQPERFMGYHTGVDFETTPAEQNIDVPIFAACDGKLLLKKYATGYGGVAVQSCRLDGTDVTVIYGHLRLASIAPNVGDGLKAGDKIAVLGTGYSTETNGERKHLHFGIHKGTSVSILGYVQTQNALSGWLDAEKYLK